MIEGPKRSVKFYATQAELLSSVSSGQQELCSLTPTYFMNFVGSGSCGVGGSFYRLPDMCQAFQEVGSGRSCEGKQPGI